MKKNHYDGCTSLIGHFVLMISLDLMKSLEGRNAGDRSNSPLVLKTILVLGQRQNFQMRFEVENLKRTMTIYLVIGID